ncbi:hypothetical protein AMECASPLE_030362 [Ameca splendens]|uniref:Uncharacterized protein n=1 Tax=Ameca splendens TaxID=208324 RepID=A0ABV0YUB8_9TELE
MESASPDHDYCFSSAQPALGYFEILTRFGSYAHLMSFWSQIEPATHDIVRVTRAQTVQPAVSTSLQPIDEFFSFYVIPIIGVGAERPGSQI